MNPIKINLAKPKADKRPDYVVITIMIGVLLASAVANGFHYINTQKEIQKYDETLVRQNLDYS